MDAFVRLREDDALREKLRARYRYILVDEFQDTNIAQLELLWLLGGRPAQPGCRRRSSPGDLPLPRRIIRQLHDFSEPLRHRFSLGP